MNTDLSKKIQTLKNYLNQPYPTKLDKWRLIIIVSAFISLFMLLFKPFGLTNYQSTYKTLIIIGYGGVTFFALAINLVLATALIPKVFVEETWKVYKEILWVLWILFTIGTGNYLYSASLFFPYWPGIKAFLFFQGVTICIGIIPIVSIVIINQNKLLARNLKSSQEINDSLNLVNQKEKEILCDRVVLTGDNEKDQLEIDSTSIVYIESVGNYIEIYYFLEGRIRKHLLRNSLKRTELQLTGQVFMYKCHRAFIVNLLKIMKVKGNSQGYRIQLQDMETDIPVSRNLIKSFREKMEYINKN